MSSCSDYVRVGLDRARSKQNGLHEFGSSGPMEKLNKGLLSYFVFTKQNVGQDKNVGTKSARGQGTILVNDVHL